MGERRIRVPKIRSLEAALTVYYDNIFIGNKEIRELFISKSGGNIGVTKIAELKKEVAAIAKEKGAMLYNETTVPVEVAFEAWGINVSELERKIKRKKSLGI